jgi:hypothetical protein
MSMLRHSGRCARWLLAFVLALVFVVPATAGSGGGDSGGNGVWILPRSSVIGGLLPTAITPPRGTCHYTSNQQPLQMKVSAEVVNPIAFLVDPITGSPILLTSTIDTVTIPPSVVNGLLAANVTSALGTIFDASSHGYYFRLRLDPVAGTADIDIF